MALNKNKVIAAAQRAVQRGQLDRAIKEYLSIVGEDPEDVRIWLKIGDLYTKKGALAQAVSTYTRVATHYSERGFFLKAVAVYKQILNIDPAYVDAHLNLGGLFVKLGLIPDAVSQYQIVVGAYERDGRFQDSRDLLQNIVDLVPEDEPNRIRLAEAHARQGTNDEAISEFKIVLKNLYSRERFDDYIQVAERLIYLSPDEYEVVRELSEVYLRRADPKRALARLQVLFRADPHDIDTLGLLAETFKNLHQAPKAISVYREIARIHGDRQDVAARNQAYRQLLALDPNDAAALAALGTASYAGSMESAETSIAPTTRRASISVEENLTPQQRIDVYLADVAIYLKYELRDHARERLDRIFEIDPHHTEALTRLKDLALASDQTNEAVDALMRLAINVQRTDPQAAIAALGELLQIQPGHVQGSALMRSMSAEASAAEPELTVGQFDEQPMVITPAPPSGIMAPDDGGGFDLPDQDEFGDLIIGEEAEASADDDMFADLLSIDGRSEFGDLLADDDEAIGGEPTPAGDVDYQALLSASRAPGPIDPVFSLDDESVDPDGTADVAGQLLISDAPQVAAPVIDDGFGDLLVADPPQIKPSRRAPAPVPDDDFGDLLVSDVKVARPSEATPTGSIDDDFGDLLAPEAPSASIPADLDNEFGDLLIGEPSASEFGDLLIGEPSSGEAVEPPDDSFGVLLTADPADDAIAGIDSVDDFASLLSNASGVVEHDGFDDLLEASVVTTGAVDTTPAADGVVITPPNDIADAAAQFAAMLEGGAASSDGVDEYADLLVADAETSMALDDDAFGFDPVAPIDVIDLSPDAAPEPEDALEDIVGAPRTEGAGIIRRRGDDVGRIAFDLDSQPGADDLDSLLLDSGGPAPGDEYSEFDLGSLSAVGQPVAVNLALDDPELVVESVAAEPEPTFDIEPEPAFDIELQTAFDSEPQPAFDIEPQPAFDIEPEPAFDIEPEPAFDIELEPAFDSEPEPAFDSEPEPAFDVEPQTAFDIEPQAAFDSEPEPAFDVEPQTAFDSEPEPAFDSEPEPAFDSEPQPAFDSEPDEDGAESIELLDPASESIELFEIGSESIELLDDLDIIELDDDDLVLVEDDDLLVIEVGDANVAAPGGPPGVPDEVGALVDRLAAELSGLAQPEDAPMTFDLGETNAGDDELDAFDLAPQDSAELSAFDLDDAVDGVVDVGEMTTEGVAVAPAAALEPAPLAEIAVADDSIVESSDGVDDGADSIVDAFFAHEVSDAEEPLLEEASAALDADDAVVEARFDTDELTDGDLESSGVLLEPDTGVTGPLPMVSPLAGLPSLPKFGNFPKLTVPPVAPVALDQEISASSPIDDADILDDFEAAFDDQDDATLMVDRADLEAMANLGGQDLAQSLAAADLTEELNELDFLLDERLEADARELLDELSVQFPGRPELAERADRLASFSAPVASYAPAADAFEDAPDFSTIQGAQLSDLNDDDVGMHFDLGVAFKEMGQYKKAIEQLEKAARSRERRLDALRVIGLCHRDRGDLPTAIESFLSALQTVDSSEQARTGVLYDLGVTHEMNGDTVSAAEQFREIISTTGEFLDTRSRLDQLGG